MSLAHREARIKSFAGVPRVVMENQDYIGLGPSAKALLFEFAFQYKGKNNGNLSATYKQMKPRGFNSPTTLSKAIQELKSTRMIVQTRQGGKNYPSLYAVSWQPIDECRGKNLEIGPTIQPPRRFTEERLSKCSVASTKKQDP